MKTQVDSVTPLEPMDIYIYKQQRYNVYIKMLKLENNLRLNAVHPERGQHHVKCPRELKRQLAGVTIHRRDLR